MQALMLAAGKGSRLSFYTKDNTKCMLSVANKKLIDRAIESVKFAGINRFILVTGYKAENLENYINDIYSNDSIEFVFVRNNDYDTTNNIYSLFLARDYLEQDDTVLMESDLIFENCLIKDIVENTNKNVAAVASYESWMDGTVVKYGKNNRIIDFIAKENMNLAKKESYFKTVNIYKLSKDFSKNVYMPFLETYIKVCGYNNYYETVLKTLLTIPNQKLYAHNIGDIKWYEIDDEQDLEIANVLFSNGKEKYDLLTSKFGGHWRYGKVIDFLYLVNPYFPPEILVEKIKNDLPELLEKYPSGLSIQNMNAGRIFNVNKENILVGNGAAELINVLGHSLTGEVAISVPTFNEYVRCFTNCNLHQIDNSKNDYKHNVKELKLLCKKMDTIMMVSPDNPSGYLLSKNEVFEILDEAKKYSCNVLIDESFIDFADEEDRYTLLDDSILEKYDNLIVVKSISKSYGVPGLRLGVLASSNLELLKTLRENMPVWNINSFGEYFLQIYNIYKASYIESCDLIAKERYRMTEVLKEIKGIKVYKSSANYLLIDLKDNNSKELCYKLLENENILVKDLSIKDYFYSKNFIRVAIRDKKDNNIFINAIKKYI